jgi:membrane-associated phospholipid phosphatase
MSSDREVGWRLIAAPPLVAALTVVAALIATAEAGFTFRDPDHVAALYVVEVGAGVALLVLLDVYLRARRRTGLRWPPKHELGAIRRERWTLKRSAIVALAIVAFYVTYLAYRNLKASLPLLRPGDLFDIQLADADRFLFFNHDPAALLHDLLGTGVAAHLLSTFYIAFIVFLPLSLGLALVFVERLAVSLFYATAMCVNWVLGLVTYFLLPSLGPIYFYPSWFADLPYTEVSRLQELLMDDRVGFLANPDTGTPQAIAAFASLHIAMSFTALLAAYILNLARGLKIALWIWLGLTFVATVYLGWHYIVDDFAGLIIGALALVIAWALTGFDPRVEREPADPEVRATEAEAPV